MASSLIDGMFGDFLGDTAEHAATAHLHDGPMSATDKGLLAATAIGGYVIARIVFSAVGLPNIPGDSTLLLAGEPAYAFVIAAIVLIGTAAAVRPIVGGIYADAPLFVGAIALLALPTHGGDLRNALLELGGGAYTRMATEQVFLILAVAGAYAVTARRRVTPVMLDPVAAVSDAAPPAVEDPHVDTAADRFTAVIVQTVVTLGLLSLLGQSPLKGQAMIGLALSAGLASWMTYAARRVHGSAYYVAGTLLAGLIAFLWTGLHPDGTAIGDARGYLAGAARSLPLHYATAGVAGTLYGYWTGRASANS